MKIKVIKHIPETLGHRPRVAAYARVSMETDKLLHSLSAQVENYRAVILNNPEWDYVGVYVDEGITGTRTDIRKGFRHLIDDCDQGLIDIILVKSISRFARNTLDCIKEIRHLRELGIAVIFERENINTLASEGEFMLTLMASYAQEESRSISENVKWGIRKRFEKGQQNGIRPSFGYYWDGGMYRILPEQGKVVKEIFARYIAGQSAYGIAKYLADKGVKGNAGRLMEQTTVKDILSNSAYTGRKVLQKYYIGSSHKKKINRGELPRYVIDDMYELLVTMEDFERAQEIRQQRASECNNLCSEHTSLSGKIKCGYCGRGVSRRTVYNGKKKWVCNTKERKGVSICDMKDISEKELISAVGNNAVRQAVLYADRIELLLDDERVKIVSRDLSGSRGHNVFSGKIRCGCCGEKCRRSNWGKSVKMWHCEKCHRGKILEKKLLDIAAEVLGDKYKSMMVDEVAEVVITVDGIKFKFKTGEVLEWKEK